MLPTGKQPLHEIRKETLKALFSLLLNVLWKHSILISVIISFIQIKRLTKYFYTNPIMRLIILFLQTPVQIENLLLSRNIPTDIIEKLKDEEIRTVGCSIFKQRELSYFNTLNSSFKLILCKIQWFRNKNSGVTCKSAYNVARNPHELGKNCLKIVQQGLTFRKSYFCPP